MTKFTADENPAYDALTKAKRANTFAIQKAARDTEDSHTMMSIVHKSVQASIIKAQRVLHDIAGNGATKTRDLQLRMAVDELISLEPILVSATDDCAKALNLWNRELAKSLEFRKAEPGEVKKAKKRETAKADLRNRSNPQTVSVTAGDTSPYRTITGPGNSMEPKPVSPDLPTSNATLQVDATTYRVVDFDFKAGDEKGGDAAMGAVVITEDGDSLLAAMSNKRKQYNVVYTRDDGQSVRGYAVRCQIAQQRDANTVMLLFRGNAGQVRA